MGQKFIGNKNKHITIKPYKRNAIVKNVINKNATDNNILSEQENITDNNITPLSADENKKKVIFGNKKKSEKEIINVEEV